MTFPVDQARTPTQFTAAADPWTVNLPTLSAGDLALMLFRANNANGAFAGGTPPSGWTALVNNNTSDASNDVTHILYRWCDGTEGASVSVDLSGTAKGATIVYRITGAENPSTQAPEVSTVAVGTGANADPTGVTPTGGSKDYLWIVFAGADGEGITYTAPTNYGNTENTNSGVDGAASGNLCIGSASRQLAAASEDPGAFTNGAPTTGWTAYTVAIHPGAVAAFLGRIERYVG